MSSSRVRMVTAASLFDGHDASINIIRRLLQNKGVEVIHLGHNRSVSEIVQAAIHEDVHAIAISSYQGGHIEYFKHLRKELDVYPHGKNIRIYGGGGGVITKVEREDLHKAGITRIYSPEDGMKLGLEGIIDHLIETATHDTLEGIEIDSYLKKGHSSSLNFSELGKIISAIESGKQLSDKYGDLKNTPVLGITGTGGAGKSSLIDEILLRFCNFAPDCRIALVSIDPTKKRTQGAFAW